MCAVLSSKLRILRPSKRVPVWRRDGHGLFVWAGFARHESLGWWKKKKGGELVDVPADRFAERSDRDGRLRWDEIPSGLVVRGVLDPNEGSPLLKIVTRASTPEEMQQFEHPRMPVIESPLFSAELIEIEPETLPGQGELF